MRFIESTRGMHPLKRPAAIWGWFLVAGGVICIIMAAVLAIQAAIRPPEILGRADMGAEYTIEQSQYAEVLVDVADGKVTCEAIEGRLRGSDVPGLAGGDIAFEGQNWSATGKVLRLRQDNVMTCTTTGDATEYILVFRVGNYLLLPACLMMFPGTGGLILGLIGIRARRKHLAQGDQRP